MATVLITMTKPLTDGMTISSIILLLSAVVDEFVDVGSGNVISVLVISSMEAFTCSVVMQQMTTYQY